MDKNIKVDWIKDSPQYVINLLSNICASVQFYNQDHKDTRLSFTFSCESITFEMRNNSNAVVSMNVYFEQLVNIPVPEYLKIHFDKMKAILEGSYQYEN